MTENNRRLQDIVNAIELEIEAESQRAIPATLTDGLFQDKIGDCFVYDFLSDSSAKGFEAAPSKIQIQGNEYDCEILRFGEESNKSSVKIKIEIDFGERI